MAELPKGVTKEVRRGGSGVLELLLIDFDREGGDGYIRIEQATEPATVAQLIIIGGSPAMALFEFQTLLMGQAALDELRTSARAEDSRISVHTEVDFSLIADLHPEAKLHFTDEDVITGQKIEGWIINTKNDSDWWRSKQKREWTMSELSSDEEIEETVAPSVIIDYHSGEELEAGCSYLIDDQTPDSVMKIATHLATIGHPLLVISRNSPQRLSDDFGLPASLCYWLTEREVEGVQTITPGLEAVRRVCDEFLWASTRSVIIIDGVEYLSGIHGFGPLLGMLRDLFDGIQTSDDIVLIPADLDVWDERERTMLGRECDLISAGLAAEWAERPAVVEGHSFCQEVAGATIPEPIQIDVLTVAEDDFKAAAHRLLTPTEQISVKEESQPVSANGTTAAHFSQPVTDFSARSLIDEMKNEDDGVIIAEKETPPIESEGVISNESDDGSDEFKLPEWATAPSANMGDEPIPTQPVVVESVEQSPTPNQTPEWFESARKEALGESTSFLEDNDSQIEPIEETLSVEIDEPSGPKQPTVNYRSKRERKISVPHKPDILQLEKSSMHYAASNSKAVETELDEPGFEAIDRTVTALNSKRDQFREIGEWQTNEERDWQVLATDEMGAAVDNSRPVRHHVKKEESSSVSRLHVRQWGAASNSASTNTAYGSTPEDIENPKMREFATRAQKSKTLIQKLVGSELEALYADRKQMVSASSIDLEILERIDALGKKGHPIRELVERIEANSKEGTKFLSVLEKRSVQVDDLIKRLNVQEERSVIDSKVAAKYRENLINFEQIKEVESLLSDFEG